MYGKYIQFNAFHTLQAIRRDRITKLNSKNLLNEFLFIQIRLFTMILRMNEFLLVSTYLCIFNNDNVSNNFERTSV